MAFEVLQGDCLGLARQLPDCSVDAIVQDPPCGIGFMNRSWDSDKGGRDHWIAWMTEVMREGLRVLKPGGHALVWALPRTSHWTATALEDAGFEVREILHAITGQGFPKSTDVSKQIDRMKGAEREIVGHRRDDRGDGTALGLSRSGVIRGEPVSPEALAWSGWGSALKPAVENWILCRKPLAETSIARNVLAFGTGALNIDACRVEGSPETTRLDPSRHHHAGWRMSATGEDTAAAAVDNVGRWPANLLLHHSPGCDEEGCVPGCPVAEIDRQSGATGDRRALMNAGPPSDGFLGGMSKRKPGVFGHNDSGGASRFFPTFRYIPKASRSEKEAGLEEFPDTTLNRVNPGGLENEHRFAPVQVKNNHITTKSITLMRWLVRLITPPGGTVLDMFAGSGTTGCAAALEGKSFIGFEQDEGYCRIARARIAHWAKTAQDTPGAVDGPPAWKTAAPARPSGKKTEGLTLNLFGCEGNA